MHLYAVTYFLKLGSLLARPYITLVGWHYVSCGLEALEGLGLTHSSTRLDREIGIPES